METGIYIIQNKINGHSYIGMSKDIPLRWKHHINESQNPNSKEYEKTLYRAFRKYGINNFSFGILEYCKEEELREKEIYWINYYNSYKNGYNETSGGKNPLQTNCSHEIEMYDLKGNYIKNYPNLILIRILYLLIYIHMYSYIV